MKVLAESNVVSNIMGILGFGATLVGLWFTFREVRKTKTAAESARDAAQQTQERIRAGMVLALFGQLSSLNRELDIVVKDQDVSGATRVVHLWRETAGELMGLVRDITDDDSIVVALRESVGLAQPAKTALEKPNAIVKDAIGKFRQATGQVLAEVGPLAAMLKTHTEEA